MKRKMRFILTSVLLFTIALTSAQSDPKPHGVTTIGGLDIWNGHLPTRGGNSFIILEQFDQDCGPTSAEMLLHYYGKWVNQNDIWDEGGIHTVHIGTFPSELKLALDGLGVPVHWYHESSLASIKSDIRENKPSLILLRFGAEGYHWVVVVGYDNRDRYLIADPNGFFEWLHRDYLNPRWGFRPVSGPAPSGAFGVTSDDFVRLKADPYTRIVPKRSPTGHWEPMWSEMKEIQITGSRRLNPFFNTEGWEYTFRFPATPDYYKVTGIKPAQLGNLGGTAQAWISGSQIRGKTVKVWGQIEYGSVTRGKLWVVVRAYRKGALINPF